MHLRSGGLAGRLGFVSLPFSFKHLELHFTLRVITRDLESGSTAFSQIISAVRLHARFIKITHFVQPVQFQLWRGWFVDEGA